MHYVYFHTQNHIISDHFWKENKIKEINLIIFCNFIAYFFLVEYIYYPLYEYQNRIWPLSLFIKWTPLIVFLSISTNLFSTTCMNNVYEVLPKKFTQFTTWWAIFDFYWPRVRRSVYFSIIILSIKYFEYPLFTAI